MEKNQKQFAGKEDERYNRQTDNDSLIYRYAASNAAKSSSKTADYCELTEESGRYKMYFPRRYLLCVLTVSGMFLINSLRVNLSVAIVAMTTNRSVMLDNGTTILVKEFNWNTKEKGFILSSYFYGYIISEFPSGWLANRFGGKTVFGMELFFSAICNFLMPTMIGYGLEATFLCRAFLGIFEGGSIPSICAIWSRWAPPSERTTLMTVSIIGTGISNVVCFFLYGNLCEIFGWRVLFYLPGVLTVLWCVIWFKCAKDLPTDDSSISQSELQYIQNSTQGETENKVNCPWKPLLTSSAVWLAVIGFVPQSWNFFFLSVELPSYFNDVWKLNVKESGFIITMTFAVSIICDVTCSLTADYLICEKKSSVTRVRKLIYTIGGCGTAIFYFLIGISKSATEATFFVLATSCSASFYYGTIFAAPMDLSPRYAPIIMGMMTTAGSASAMIGPIIIGYVTTHQTKEEWLVPFMISSGVCLTGAILYSTFASSEVQHWPEQISEDDEAPNIESSH